ncbi:MAG: hypothetical protein HBSAPP03_02020 [Phycisphaerae bacterium]|nr:MAG: hypothetical protein HBSAPP03_02020 [Phycisphaerae bacterium]
MWIILLVVSVGVLIGAAFFAWAAFAASQRLWIEQRGDSLVLINTGQEVRSANISITVGGRELRVRKDVIPHGETVLVRDEFVPPCPPLGTSTFTGGSITGSRSVGGVGVDWTWYSAGPMSLASETREPPGLP